jgi:uncharacterized protein
VHVDLAPFRRARRGGLEERFAFELPPGETPLGRGVRLAESSSVVATVDGGAQEVRVRVEADLALACPCDRCLEAVRLPLSVSYAEQWRLARRRSPGADSLDEADDDDTVRRVIDGDGADLDEGFWQNAALELPAKVLCAESCRGLCPVCGRNRNTEPCACREAARDPRLAALAEWRPARRP